MKLTRRLSLLVSIFILISAATTLTNLDNFSSKNEVAKNLLNGLPGENNQILVSKESLRNPKAWEELMDKITKDPKLLNVFKRLKDR